MVLIALTDASLNETLPPAHVWGEEHNTLVGRVLTGWTTALAGCLSWGMGFVLVEKVQRAAVGPLGLVTWALQPQGYLFHSFLLSQAVHDLLQKNCLYTSLM